MKNGAAYLPLEHFGDGGGLTASLEDLGWGRGVGGGVKPKKPVNVCKRAYACETYIIKLGTLSELPRSDD